MARLSDDMREKLTIALLGFFLTGVLGAMATTWIQQRGWTWQNRVAKIDKDTQNALAAYQNVSDLVNARWHATYRVVRAIERGAEGDEWKSARAEFAASDKDWAIRYTNVARDVAFYVDTPFGIDARDKFKLVWPLPCDGYAVGSTIGASSARLVLEVVNHCAGIVKSDLEKAADLDSDTAPKLEPAARKSLADPAYAKLDALYRTNETLRCLIFGRALTMRQSLAVDGFWGAFFGLADPSYKTPDEKECVS